MPRARVTAGIRGGRRCQQIGYVAVIDLHHLRRVHLRKPHRR
jgi:hypothetical protein